MMNLSILAKSRTFPKLLQLILVEIGGLLRSTGLAWTTAVRVFAGADGAVDLGRSGVTLITDTPTFPVLGEYDVVLRIVGAGAVACIVRATRKTKTKYFIKILLLKKIFDAALIKFII